MNFKTTDTTTAAKTAAMTEFVAEVAPKSTGERTVEIVVSRFCEDISWVCDPQFAAFRKIVYNKGPTPTRMRAQSWSSNTTRNVAFEYREVALPNVGREGHTFLHHIVHCYDSLADVTILLPGSCMDELKLSQSRELIERAIHTRDTVIAGKWYADVQGSLYNFSIDGWVGWSADNQKQQPSSSCAPAPVRPFGRWYEAYIGLMRTQVVCFTSTLAISREHVHQHPKSRYEAILESLSMHSNPEVGHFLERSWQGLFYPIPVGVQWRTRCLVKNCLGFDICCRIGVLSRIVLDLKNQTAPLPSNLLGSICVDGTWRICWISTSHRRRGRGTLRERGTDETVLETWLLPPVKQITIRTATQNISGSNPGGYLALLVPLINNLADDMIKPYLLCKAYPKISIFRIVGVHPRHHQYKRRTKSTNLFLRICVNGSWNTIFLCPVARAAQVQSASFKS
jgi:hypothetical protein